MSKEARDAIFNAAKTWEKEHADLFAKLREKAHTCPCGKEDLCTQVNLAALLEGKASHDQQYVYAVASMSKLYEQVETQQAIQDFIEGMKAVAASLPGDEEPPQGGIH